MTDTYRGTKQAGEYDFDGACAPRLNGWASPNETFSLGIFRLEPASRGKRLKRGKVVIRVVGHTSAAEPVYAKAREICDALNAGAKLESYRKRIVV